MRQIPLVGIRNVSAGRNVHGGLSHKVHKGRKGTLKFYRGDHCGLRASFWIAGWRAILRIAFSSSCFPGGILCQGEAPEGCGSGIKSKICSARCARNSLPTTLSSFSHSMNWVMANRPTGIMSRGFNILISSFIQGEQLPISSGAGTRSAPPGAFPGKHRQTAAK